MVHSDLEVPVCPHCNREIYEVQAQVVLLIEWDAGEWIPDLDETHMVYKTYWCTKCGGELENGCPTA